MPTNKTNTSSKIFVSTQRPFPFATTMRGCAQPGCSNWTCIERNNIILFFQTKMSLNYFHDSRFNPFNANTFSETSCYNISKLLVLGCHTEGSLTENELNKLEESGLPLLYLVLLNFLVKRSIHTFHRINQPFLEGTSYIQPSRHSHFHMEDLVNFKNLQNWKLNS